MKNLTKMFSLTATSIAIASSMFVATNAQAEVSASAAVSNFYLWRGFDLSAVADSAGNVNSAPAVSGDLNFSSEAGVYAGVWASSGDEALGQEYDLYFGWGGDLGAVSLDVSYWSYVYPGADIDPNDAADIVVGLGFGDFGVTFYQAVEGADEQLYTTFDYSVDKFNILYGVGTDFGDVDGADYSHIQLSYSATDNLSFTGTIASDDGVGIDEDLLVNVAYSF